MEPNIQMNSPLIFVIGMITDYKLLLGFNNIQRLFGMKVLSQDETLFFVVKGISYVDTA